MSDTALLEKRLAVVEKELAELKRQITDGRPPANWFKEITGSFAGDPDFAEILRLGAEIRHADRPSDDEE